MDYLKAGAHCALRLSQFFHIVRPMMLGTNRKLLTVTSENKDLQPKQRKAHDKKEDKDSLQVDVSDKLSRQQTEMWKLKTHKWIFEVDELRSLTKELVSNSGESYLTRWLKVLLPQCCFPVTGFGTSQN